MRLAWFSPMPPHGRDAPDLSATVVPLLAEHHQVEVFAQSRRQAEAWHGWHVPVRDPYEFVWRAHQAPYDLVVYQLSNEPGHDYVWGYIWNYPGLVVLQDVHFHHARARILLEGREQRLHDYSRELRFNQGVNPAVGGSLAAFTGPVLHVWPMRRAVVAAGRAVAVHNDRLAHDLRQECPWAAIDYVRPGVPDPGTHVALRERPGARGLRARLAVPEEAVVAVMFGPFTRSSRVTEVLKAFAALRESDPGLHLLLAGSATDECDPLAEAQAAGVMPKVRTTGPVEQGAWADVLGAADLALCPRWPTAGETPLAWLTCLAAGLPAIITDLAHQADLPVLDPRDWTVQHAGRAPYVPQPIAVVVDLLDEVETLRLALRRLAADHALRQVIARAGRGWWQQHHTPAAMVEDYTRVMAHAVAHEPPPIAVPEHHRPDVFGHARGLLQPAARSLPADLELGERARITRDEPSGGL